MKKKRLAILHTVMTISILGLMTAPIEAISPQNKPQILQKFFEEEGSKVSKHIQMKSSKPVDVMIEISQSPTGSFVKNYKNLKTTEIKERESQVKRAIGEVEQKMKKVSPKIEMKQQFSMVFSGFHVSIPANEIPKLAVLPEVKAVYPISTYKPQSIGGPTIGAPEIWKMKDQKGLPVDGKGIKVAVLDTGIDYKHPDLKDNYIGGYDQVDRDNDPLDPYGGGHGTHVAGIIAANGKLKGIAPKASILAYRMGTTSGDMIAGIERAVSDGADVMNISVGVEKDYNYPDDALSIALDNTTKMGVSVVVANGNNGAAGDWSLQNLATLENVISVGSSAIPRNYLTFQMTGISKMLEGIMMTTHSFSNTSFEVVDVGSGSPSDYKTLDVKGKLVLIQSEDSDIDSSVIEAFISTAQNTGATGVLFSIKGEESVQGAKSDISSKIPMAQISSMDADVLKATLKEGKNKLSVSGSASHELVADSSSRGPVHKTWAIKPDIVAPGVGITSTLPNNKYGGASGTSQAAPQVTGAVALIKQMHPEWTPEEIKAALSNTAKLLTDKKGKSYDVMTQGSGRIDISKAISTTTLAIPNNLTYGMIKPNSGEVKLDREITIQNRSKQNRTYVSRVELAHRGKGVQVQVPKEIKVKGESKEEFPLQLTIDSSLPRGIYSGYLYLKEGKNEERVPFTFSIHPNSLKRVNYMSASDLFISPNGDHIQDDTTFSYYTPIGAKNVSINLKAVDKYEDMENGKGKTVGKIHQEENIKSGWNSFKWKGTLLDQKEIQQGLYQIEIVVTGEDNVEGSFSQFIVIDKTAPIMKANVHKQDQKVDVMIEDYLMKFDTDVSMWMNNELSVNVEYQLEGTKDWVQIPLSEKMEIKPPKAWIDSGKTKISIRATDDAGNKSNLEVEFKW
ncbi:minor extracellular serine protease Vpr [Thermoactinomyces sp. DSM 45891]|uniref:S8 family serine peptidase n=1 Tax=Thermoactinomyces sp. DSM 45891 TaxID=1761907 RepID=UPI0009158A98|nr:S8 family serine peptidase [Thermoactinomyces sp. DSM 45891]SFW97913.1 minor extracellular serine protease Vpr [Thermoactinomyces sp. DSM 45891]